MTTLQTVQANGITQRFAEAGDGPLVIMLHGFPESWYSYRHQLEALAEAGYHAVAPDMRGYGGTDAPGDVGQYTYLHTAGDVVALATALGASRFVVVGHDWGSPAAASVALFRPDPIEAYTLFHIVGDMVALVPALGAEKAVIVGHDWGAPVAWHAALLRPDVFRGVAGLSVPFRPRGSVRPTSAMPRTERSFFYQLYFQEPGWAEAEFERDPRATIRQLLYSASGDVPRGPSADAPGDAAPGMVPRSGGLLTRLIDPPSLPSWLTEADVAFYASEFGRTGFRGGLNWYRNIDRNWELMAPFAGFKVAVPALYVAGDRDLVVGFPGAAQLIANLKTFVPQLSETIMLPGCGHWTQQERPEAVNAALLKFLRGLG